MENSPEIIEQNQSHNAEIYPVQWVEQVKRLKDLRPFEQNPRTISKPQFEKLKESLIRNGQFKPILATNDLRIAGGHQRLKAMQELGWTECRVTVPDRPISDQQFLELVVLDNHNNGLFDMDMLANMFDLEELRGFGLHEVTSIAPEESEMTPPKNMVLCPKCNFVFPVKGNKAT